MFDIGWSEMAIILLVALIVIGPRDLPRVARTMGRWVGKGRAMAREFQTALEDMARETELDTVKREIEKAGRTNVGKTLEKAVDPKGELKSAFDPSTPNGGGKDAKGNGEAASAPGSEGAKATGSAAQSTAGREAAAATPPATPTPTSAAETPTTTPEPRPEAAHRPTATNGEAKTTKRETASVEAG